MPILLPSPDAGGLRALADQADNLVDALRRLAAGAPNRADLADAPVLDCWRPASRFAPALLGLVDGHPIIGANRTTLTSELFAIDTDAGWARTWSRWYRLGDPLPSGDGRRH